MIARCLKCGNDFEQKKSERTCGCRPSRRKNYRSYHAVYVKRNPHSVYLFKLTPTFQDPIYQFKRLIHDEWLGPWENWEGLEEKM